MNGRQKRILRWAFFLCVCMLSVPPYSEELHGGAYGAFKGYSFILWPPPASYPGVAIDIRILAWQLVGMTVATAVVFAVFGTQRRPTDGTARDGATAPQKRWPGLVSLGAALLLWAAAFVGMPSFWSSGAADYIYFGGVMIATAVGLLAGVSGARRSRGVDRICAYVGLVLCCGMWAVACVLKLLISNGLL